MNDGELLKVFVNPLAIPSEMMASICGAPRETTAESVLEFLCTPGLASDVEALVGRYREIRAEPDPLTMVPDGERILGRLVWPLRQAMGAYMLGNYLGTIALCGLVSEMVAIMIFEIAEPEINGSRMGNTEQERLFGSTFEKLSQHRRVSILHAYGLIDDALKTSFDRIRTTRRQYLHLWSKSHDGLPGDAVNCYRDALKILASVLAMPIRDGQLVPSPKFARYLRTRGVFVAKESES